MDSRDEAFAKLDSTRDYIFSISEDVNRGMAKGLFKPPTSAEKTAWLDQWRSFEHEFVAYYNAQQDAGISRIDAGDCIAKCAEYVNRARAFQTSLAALGVPVLTTLPPEDKPPPTLPQALVETSGNLAKAALAGLAVVVLISLRK